MTLPEIQNILNKIKCRRLAGHARRSPNFHLRHGKRKEAFRNTPFETERSGMVRMVGLKIKSG